MPRVPRPQLLQELSVNREQARALRESAREGRHWAEELMARARYLRARHKKLETQEAEAQLAAAEPRSRNRLHVRRLEVLEQLKQSLFDLEGIRMTPEHDPELQNLKDDIRKTIAASGTG